MSCHSKNGAIVLSDQQWHVRASLYAKWSAVHWQNVHRGRAGTGALANLEPGGGPVLLTGADEDLEQHCHWVGGDRGRWVCLLTKRQWIWPRMAAEMFHTRWDQTCILCTSCDLWWNYVWGLWGGIFHGLETPSIQQDQVQFINFSIQEKNICQLLW